MYYVEEFVNTLLKMWLLKSKPQNPNTHTYSSSVTHLVWSSVWKQRIENKGYFLIIYRLKNKLLLYLWYF